MANYIWPEITADTPIEEVKRIHQQIWDYVIEHGKKPKTPYHINSIACEYIHAHGLNCCGCPINWPTLDPLTETFPVCASDSIHGLYSQWCCADGEYKIVLAKQIRDLLWKFELEEKRNDA